MAFLTSSRPVDAKISPALTPSQFANVNLEQTDLRRFWSKPSGRRKPSRQLPGKARVRSIVVTVMALAVLHGAHANEGVFASVYGPVVRDLIDAFHAEMTTCHAAIDIPDICFEVAASGAGQLAEAFEEVMVDFRAADLRLGEWRSENGVWAIDLYLVSGALGTLEMYLTESSRGEVRGMFVLREP